MTEVGLRAARALDAGAASGFTRSVPKESPRAEEAPETREYRGTGSSARMYASARLYAPPAMRQNVNATTVNALVAVTLAASAPAPEPYPVYAVDEDGNELIDEPPVRRVPMRRRLTVPRGLLGAYDIVTRMDEPEDPATDAEDELEGLGFPATSPVAVTVARVAPRTGAPAFLSRGANAAGSESARASSAFAAEDHASRSATNARTSASRSARASAEVLPDCDPRDARRAFATCAVVGNPSSLNVGNGTNRGWDEDVSCRVSVCQSVSVSVSVACVPSRLVTARRVSEWRSAREKGRRACFGVWRRVDERRGASGYIWDR